VGDGSPGAFAFDRFAAAARSGLEEALAAHLPSPAPRAEGLAQAIADAVMSPGKRLRPLATLAASDVARAARETAMPVAVAVEYVHAASLVLDDLPSMDDAPRRRGRPALHLTWGVATAELASVALLARAFEIVASGTAVSPALASRILGELAGAVGADGCCAGQAADLAADPSSLTLDDLESIHARKTGALFVAAVRGGALCGGAGERTLSALTLYARNLGLAFQLTDDLLDQEGDPRTLGKDPGRDGHRANFATVLGADSAHRLVDELLRAAVEALRPLGRRAEVLEDLARVVRDRRS
jgi:geranylgeranyl pyrophosphate synthase